MQWWATGPIVFVRDGDLECDRIRLMIAEKRANCAVRVFRSREVLPEFVAELNPDSVFPFLACKDLACYGHALEELLHESYTQFALLPEDPLKRAQLRLLADQVRSWYSESPMALRGKIKLLSAMFNPSLPFFASREISVLDIAIAPLLFAFPRIQYSLMPGEPFTGYARMMLGRPVFNVLPRPLLSPWGLRMACAG